MPSAFRLPALKSALALALAIFAGAAIGGPREVPYWASVRVHEVNMRVGPSEDYRISWVYRRQGLPLKVLRLKEGWRLVQDPDGARGWILAQFLTRQRAGIVIGNEPADMREAAAPSSHLRWRFPAGYVGKLGECSGGWCQIDIGGRAGYMRQERLWGAGGP